MSGPNVEAVPKYSVEHVADGDKETIAVAVALPGVADSSQIRCVVEDYVCKVHVPGRYKVEIALTKAVEPKAEQVRFVKKKSVLKCVLRVKEDWRQQRAGTAAAEGSSDDETPPLIDAEGSVRAAPAPAAAANGHAVQQPGRPGSKQQQQQQQQQQAAASAGAKQQQEGEDVFAQARRQANREAAEDCERLARQAERNGDLERAVRLLQKACQLFPGEKYEEALAEATRKLAAAKSAAGSGGGGSGSSSAGNAAGQKAGGATSSASGSAANGVPQRSSSSSSSSGGPSIKREQQGQRQAQQGQQTQQQQQQAQQAQRASFMEPNLGEQLNASRRRQRLALGSTLPLVVGLAFMATAAYLMLPSPTAQQSGLSQEAAALLEAAPAAATAAAAAAINAAGARRSRGAAGGGGGGGGGSPAGMAPPEPGGEEPLLGPFPWGSMAPSAAASSAAAVAAAGAAADEPLPGPFRPRTPEGAAQHKQEDDDSFLPGPFSVRQVAAAGGKDRGSLPGRAEDAMAQVSAPAPQEVPPGSAPMASAPVRVLEASWDGVSSSPSPNSPLAGAGLEKEEGEAGVSAAGAGRSRRKMHATQRDGRTPPKGPPLAESRPKEGEELEAEAAGETEGGPGAGSNWVKSWAEGFAERVANSWPVVKGAAMLGRAWAGLKVVWRVVSWLPRVLLWEPSFKAAGSWTLFCGGLYLFLPPAQALAGRADRETASEEWLPRCFFLVWLALVWLASGGRMPAVVATLLPNLPPLRGFYDRRTIALVFFPVVVLLARAPLRWLCGGVGFCLVKLVWLPRWWTHLPLAAAGLVYTLKRPDNDVQGAISFQLMLLVAFWWLSGGGWMAVVGTVCFLTWVVYRLAEIDGVNFRAFRAPLRLLVWVPLSLAIARGVWAWSHSIWMAAPLALTLLGLAAIWQATPGGSSGGPGGRFNFFGSGRHARRGAGGIPVHLPELEVPEGAPEVVAQVLRSGNYYEVLGVERDADDAAIRRAKRSLALATHPDKVGNQPGVNEAFNLITEAADALGDPGKRQEYEAELTRLEFEARCGSDAAGGGIFGGAGGMPGGDLSGEDLGLGFQVPCGSCGGYHTMSPVLRPPEAARLCTECKTMHPVKEGEVWIERTSAGWWSYQLRMFCCWHGVVLDMTEIAACEGFLEGARQRGFPFNAHLNPLARSMSARMGTRGGSGSGRAQQPAGGRKKKGRRR